MECGEQGSDLTYTDGVVLRDFMSGVVDKNIRQSTLLMDDSLEVPFVVRERGFWLL